MSTVRDAFNSMPWGPAPESAALAAAWLERFGRKFGHFIGGRSVEPVSAEYFATMNPANRQELALVAQGSAADVDAAVRAAREAQTDWWALGGHRRARHLYAIARLIQKHSRLAAVVETLDNGKPIRESRDLDIPLAARHFYYHAGWAQLMEAEFPGALPLGVVGQIIPWNFPLLMLAWKIAPALAMGNTIVLKPAELTPLSALLFGEICAEAGLPPGVVNIVTGDGRTGEALVTHEGVDKIAFTGSTEVGRAIRAATAGSGKKLSLELGGKSPFIVFEDADLDSVVEGVVDAIWFNQGQVCCAGSRILVQEGIADHLTAKLRARMETLRMGDPLDKSIDIGAIIAPVQLEKITALVARGVAEGATLWQPSWSCPMEGLFYPPTLFTNVSPASTIAQVEIFGPVVVSMTFRTPVEAVELANNTRYGLAASVWTENVSTALDIAPQLKAGTVWINCTNMFDAAAGFGGYRESGFGREGGREGLWEYVKAARRQGGKAASEAAAQSKSPDGSSASQPAALPPCRPAALSPIDRSPKLYIGGERVRPDSGYSMKIMTAADALAAEVPLGSRKDIRNAVEAAHAAKGWAKATAHLRAQVLYYIAENLSLRSAELAGRIETLTGADSATAAAEVERSIERTFTWAAWADKYDGRVHATPYRNVTLAMNEPVGVLGVIAPESPTLLGFLSMVLPPLAMGNTVVAVPSERWPILAIDCYQVFDTSDVPPGVINIITGKRDELASVLAAHDDVDGVWYVGSSEGSTDVERRSTGNMKRTWVDYGKGRDWWDDGEGEEFLREATQVKNIWVPYGA
ncbi:MAG: aldehyde dehydrogenase family protein [Gemmatimonadota bacterium]